MDNRTPAQSQDKSPTTSQVCTSHCSHHSNPNNRSWKTTPTTNALAAPEALDTMFTRTSLVHMASPCCFTCASCHMHCRCDALAEPQSHTYSCKLFWNILAPAAQENKVEVMVEVSNEEIYNTCCVTTMHACISIFFLCSLLFATHHTFLIYELLFLLLPSFFT